MAMATKIQVVFYSMYGHLYQMAEAVAAGAREVQDAAVSLYHVGSLAPTEQTLTISAKAT